MRASICNRNRPFKVEMTKRNDLSISELLRVITSARHIKITKTNCVFPLALLLAHSFRRVSIFSSAAVGRTDVPFRHRASALRARLCSRRSIFRLYVGDELINWLNFSRTDFDAQNNLIERHFTPQLVSRRTAAINYTFQLHLIYLERDQYLLLSIF